MIDVHGDDHVRGPVDAPVTLLEYGDFECPYCRAAEPAIAALLERYGDRLRFVFRSFPLEMHAHAHEAAAAAEFAADAGRFWEMHDALMHAPALDRAHVLAIARERGLDADRLARALDERTYDALIDDVKEGGEDAGIPGTPAFFLNGELFDEEPTEANLTHAIDYLLEHGRA